MADAAASWRFIAKPYAVICLLLSFCLACRHTNAKEDRDIDEKPGSSQIIGKWTTICVSKQTNTLVFRQDFSYGRELTLFKDSNCLNPEESYRQEGSYSIPSHKSDILSLDLSINKFLRIMHTDELVASMNNIADCNHRDWKKGTAVECEQEPYKLYTVFRLTGNRLELGKQDMTDGSKADAMAPDRRPNEVDTDRYLTRQSGS